MTTATVYLATCEFCADVRDALSSGLEKTINACERIGTARAASQLAIHGFHDEAKALMTSISKED